MEKGLLAFYCNIGLVVEHNILKGFKDGAKISLGSTATPPLLQGQMNFFSAALMGKNLKPFYRIVVGKPWAITY